MQEPLQTGSNTEGTSVSASNLERTPDPRLFEDVKLPGTVLTNPEGVQVCILTKKFASGGEDLQLGSLTQLEILNGPEKGARMEIVVSGSTKNISCSEVRMHFGTQQVSTLVLGNPYQTSAQRCFELIELFQMHGFSAVTTSLGRTGRAVPQNNSVTDQVAFDFDAYHLPPALLEADRQQFFGAPSSRSSCFEFYLTNGATLRLLESSSYLTVAIFPADSSKGEALVFNLQRSHRNSDDQQLFRSCFQALTEKTELGQAESIDRLLRLGQVLFRRGVFSSPILEELRDQAWFSHSDTLSVTPWWGTNALMARERTQALMEGREVLDLNAESRAASEFSQLRVVLDQSGNGSVVLGNAFGLRLVFELPKFEASALLSEELFARRQLLNNVVEAFSTQPGQIIDLMHGFKLEMLQDTEYVYRGPVHPELTQACLALYRLADQLSQFNNGTLEQLTNYHAKQHLPFELRLKSPYELEACYRETLPNGVAGPLAIAATLTKDGLTALTLYAPNLGNYFGVTPCYRFESNGKATLNATEIFELLHNTSHREALYIPDSALYRYLAQTHSPEVAARTADGRTLGIEQTGTLAFFFGVKLSNLVRKVLARFYRD